MPAKGRGRRGQQLLQQPAARLGAAVAADTPTEVIDQGLPPGYREFLDSIKSRVQAAQVRSVLAANAELVLLYWELGGDISARMTREGWGTKVVDRLADDLRRAFPGMKGFSPRNLRYMRAFAEAWPDQAIVQQLAARLPWFHHCVLIDRVKSAPARLFYVQKTLTEGWSRSVLAIQIERGLHGRQGGKVTNFDRTLPALVESLPRELAGQLPTVEALEAELSDLPTRSETKK